MEFASVTGEIKAIRREWIKLPKTANIFSASRINLLTLSMKINSSPSESIKTSWGRWVNQRLSKIWKKNWIEGRSLELQGWTSLRVYQLARTNSVLDRFSDKTQSAGIDWIQFILNLSLRKSTGSTILRGYN